MKQKHRLLFGFALLPLCAACFAPDTPAIREKLESECGFAPGGPACTSDYGVDADVQNQVWRRYVSNINSPREQACVLDVNCEDRAERFHDIVSDIAACMSLDPSPPSWPESTRCDDCPPECLDLDAECTVALVDRCADHSSACAACGASDE